MLLTFRLVLAATAVLASVQALPIVLSRRSKELEVCGIELKRDSVTYGRQCKGKPGYVYEVVDAHNVDGDLVKTTKKWQGNSNPGDGEFECDHLVEAQWLHKMIIERSPGHRLPMDELDPLCKGMADDDGEALKKVLNEGNNMWGVPTGVNQLKKEVTTNPTFKEWKKTTYSPKYNYNKASGGLVSYFVAQGENAKSVAGELFDVLAGYDSTSFPKDDRGKARAAWVGSLAADHQTTITTLNDPAFRASLEQICTPHNNPALDPANKTNRQLKKEANAQAPGKTKSSLAPKAKAQAIGKPPTRIQPTRASKDEANKKIDEGKLAERAWHTLVHWARSALQLRAKQPQPASASSEEINWCPEEPMTTDSSSSASSTATATSASSGSRNSTATASSSGKSRTSNSTSVASGSLSSTGAVPTRLRASSTASLGSDGDEEALDSTVLRPTASAGRASLASRPLATSISTRLGAGASAAVQPTRSILRASGALPSPIQSIASPLRNPTLSNAHSLVSPAAAARPTALSSPASAPPRPVSGGTVPRPQAGSAAAPLPAKPLSKPSVASPPSRGSKKLGRLFSRDLGGI